MRKQRDNLVYIRHMLEAMEKLIEYTETHRYAEFNDNEWDQDAVIRNLEIIGEAANNTDTEFKQKHPSIPWREIISFRNVLAHDYADIDSDIVWNILTEQLPELRTTCTKLLEDDRPV